MSMNRRMFTLASAGALAAAGLARGTGAHAHEGHAHAAPAAPSPLPPGVADVVRDPADLPGPIGRRGPASVRVDLETSEVTGRLDEGASYSYWTFNGKVPGPFVRVRVGDTVEVTMRNADDSAMSHNVDFHAVTGPGGGGAVTVAAPGERKGFTFQALNPGLYTDKQFGNAGEIGTDHERLLDERPTHVLFNGAVGALTERAPLRATVGETVRIFFGVGGPNLTSSFHVIGEIFDKVYTLGDVTSRPLTSVQTISVPPGGAAVVDFKLEVPGRFLLVDHALSRLDKGCVGFLQVDGPENPEVFSVPRVLADIR